MMLNAEAWTLNLKLALLDMTTWQDEYVKKQRAKNPAISIEELSRKIKAARARKYAGQYDFLIWGHPAAR